MTETEIDRQLREMKSRVPVGGQSHQEVMRNFILEKLGEMGYVPTEQLYDRGGGLDDCIVYKGVYSPKDSGESIQAAAKITTNVSLGSILDPNANSYSELKAREMQTWRHVNHPNVPKHIASETFPFGFGNMDVLLTELIEAPTIREKIRRKEPLSEKELKTVLTGILPVFNHLHTELDIPVVVRDVHPGNILLNSKAYLTDFGIVRPVKGQKTNVTHIENGGYLPMDAIGEDPMPHHDIASLGNVVIAGIMGQEIGRVRTKQELGGLDMVRVDNLPVSEQYRGFIGKMIADPRNRFQTAKEALEGLERIVGMPVAIAKIEEPTPPEKREERNEVGSGSQGLPTVRDDGEGNREIIIDGFRFDKKSNVYDTARSIYNYTGEHFVRYINGSRIATHKDFLGNNSQFVLAYLEHVAPQHPEIRDALDRKRTLEDAAREKAPKKSGYRDTNHTTGDHFWFKDSQDFNERRKQLYDVFGEKAPVSVLTHAKNINKKFSAGNHLAEAGYSLLSIPLLPLAYLTHPLFNYLTNRSIISKARQLDSWIAEARKSQGRLEAMTYDKNLSWEVNESIASAKLRNLEGRVEQDVKLTFIDKGEVVGGSIGRGFDGAVLGALVGAMGALICDITYSPPLTDGSLDNIVSWLTSLGGVSGGTYGMYSGARASIKSIRARKRTDRGLPAVAERETQKSDIRVIGERGTRQIERITQGQKPEILGGELGKYADEWIQAKYGKFPAINSVGYKKLSGVVKGSTPFYVVAVNEFFRENGINLMVANQADLERALRQGTLNLKGHYEDTSLVLRTTFDEDNPDNTPLAKSLAEQLGWLGKFAEGHPALIPLTELKLEEANNHYGLTLKTKNYGSTVYQVPILATSGQFNSEDIDKKTGIPTKLTAHGNRILYTRSFGLSRMGLGLYSDDVDLADSNDYGRVVVVGAGSTVPEISTDSESGNSLKQYRAEPPSLKEYLAPF